MWISRALLLDEKQMEISPLAILYRITCLFHSSKRTDRAEFAGGEVRISIAKIAPGCIVVHLERISLHSLMPTYLR